MGRAAGAAAGARRLLAGASDAAGGRHAPRQGRGISEPRHRAAGGSGAGGPGAAERRDCRLRRDAGRVPRRPAPRAERPHARHPGDVSGVARCACRIGAGSGAGQPRPRLGGPASRLAHLVRVGAVSGGAVRALPLPAGRRRQPPRDGRASAPGRYAGGARRGADVAALLLDAASLPRAARVHDLFRPAAGFARKRGPDLRGRGGGRGGGFEIGARGARRYTQRRPISAQTFRRGDERTHLRC